MKKLLFLLLIALSYTCNAQISYLKKNPPSFNYKLPQNSKIQLEISEEMNRIEVNKKIGKDMPQIFALPIEVDYNMSNSGNWIVLDNGDKIWQLVIQVGGAENLNFHFSNFELAEGTEFYIFNDSRSDVRGSFTSKNNRLDKSFSIYLLKGETATLEFYHPKNVNEESNIEIERVYYGLKGITDFGDSGGCNINVNCPNGADWQIDKKANALILSGGLGGITWCSGAMVNNVRQDGTPYFLTANHCLTGTENNWAFIYNYESPNCNDIDGSYNESVLGATVVANDSPSDFALLLLDNSPPPSYGVYHSGWDAKDTIKDTTIAIHHPSGDIKKISFDFDSITSAGYSGGSAGPGDDHWVVWDWDSGTTEGGSSGSPLYDTDHRIIGQLHGGFAACGNDSQDLYGKFSYSWNEGTTAATRLRDWLDPDSTGVINLGGGDFNTPLTTLDASGTSIKDLQEEYCDSVINSAKYVFSNLGEDTLLNAINVYLTNSLGVNLISNYSWNGILAFTEKFEYSIPTFISALGNNELMVIVSNPNGSVIDSNVTNDTIYREFIMSQGNLFEAKVQTDFWGYETTYSLLDSNSNIVMTGDNLTSSSLNIESNCIDNGCYTFTIYDSYPDGISGGGATIAIGGNDIHFIDGDNFTDEESFEFCICDGVVHSNVSSVNCGVDTSSPGPGPEAILASTIDVVNISPNPSKGFFNVSSNYQIIEIVVYDLLGNKLFKEEILSEKGIVDLTSFANGFYFLGIKTNDEFSIHKVSKN